MERDFLIETVTGWESLLDRTVHRMLCNVKTGTEPEVQSGAWHREVFLLGDRVHKSVTLCLWPRTPAAMPYAMSTRFMALPRLY
jgi:hypothetical protein